MSRRKQAKPRSLKRDEEWDDGNEQNVLEAAEQDNETTAIKHYLQDGRLTSVQGPDLENQNSLDSGESFFFSSYFLGCINTCVVFSHRGAEFI
ncbi:hypothetical protein DMN91_003744 [Ooceraea biroi]|uniref:Uncharacterized protein n=1 Tax=Ooceraea biroi TaxID=2015173 RepID=A0A3L8DUF7_OOCBI|nr:hypothetical protein DMN91_003744 [Ooceraea biroi]